MTDKRFLKWIHGRLESHGEDPNVDYMHQLRAIINGMDVDVSTPNVASMAYSSECKDWMHKENDDE